MRRRSTRCKNHDEDLTVAVGLAWGLLKSLQFDQVEQLTRGCLRVWPGDKHLLLIAAYAAVELGEPLDGEMLAALKEGGSPGWEAIVLRRAACDTGRALSGKMIGMTGGSAHAG